MKPIERRTILKSSVLAGAGSLLGTSRTWAGANDRMRVAMIGVGGRGGSVMKTVADIDGVEVVTVCDPDENRMRERAGELEASSGKLPKLEPDLRRIMDDRSIDAVVITCCNHWHAMAGILACQSDKHAYVEKPISHNLREGRMLVDAARKYKRIVSGGTQRRSHPNFQHAIKLIHDGLIGDIYMTRWLLPSHRASIGFKKPEPPPSSLHWDLWRGPAPDQPYHANLVHYNWHWFWDFGNGEMGNNGSHSVDICCWGLGKGKGLPTRVQALGGRFGYDDQAETPNTMTTTYTYADGTILVGEIRGVYTGEPRSWHFYGTKGHMEISTGGLFKVYMGKSKEREPEFKAPQDPPQGFGPVDRTQFTNWVDAIRAGKPEMLNAEIEDIHVSNAFCHLANASYRLGRELNFDLKSETFKSDDEANQLLTREYHKDFRLPERV
ncbi:MAG: Gfo/Idh/MocA family oxidoreductase [Acidobacteria bacterium]|nr:Gfo/Idh/MocA family oxidoreductase [Acidobacteriota bacterium]